MPRFWVRLTESMRIEAGAAAFTAPTTCRHGDCFCRSPHLVIAEPVRVSHSVKVNHIGMVNAAASVLVYSALSGACQVWQIGRKKGSDFLSASFFRRKVLRHKQCTSRQSQACLCCTRGSSHLLLRGTIPPLGPRESMTMGSLQ